MLVPLGSGLYGTESLAPYVGPFDPETFSYRWTHPDPRMDALQRKVAAVVEESSGAGESAERVLAHIERLADAADGRPTAGGGWSSVDQLSFPKVAFVPRLTEAWFC
jgi:hypothetical protein